MNNALTTGIVFITFFLLLSSCSTQNPEPVNDQKLTVVREWVDGCKGTTKSNLDNSYIELLAEPQNQLKVRFVNASFNCCPGEIHSDAVLKNQVLTINFYETEHSCKCICNYDVECVIEPLANKEYQIEIYCDSTTLKSEFKFIYSNDLYKKVQVK